MKKQTAVQWLIDGWFKFQKDGEKITWQQIIEITKLALEKEREQIEEAYIDGLTDISTYDSNNVSDYYTQTFKP